MSPETVPRYRRFGPAAMQQTLPDNSDRGDVDPTIGFFTSVVVDDFRIPFLNYFLVVSEMLIFPFSLLGKKRF